MVTVLLKRYSGCITSRMKTGPSMCGLLKTQPVKLGKLFSSDFSNAKIPKMMKIHATCNETKRILSLQKGGEVKELRHRFLQVFSDVFLDQVAPADVKLQRYDPSFEDYVELNSDEKIEDDTKIRALVSKQDKQTGAPSAGEVETNSKHLHWGPHWVFPWIHIHGTTENCFLATDLFSAHKTGSFKPHPVDPDTNYRLWSPVSNGLLQRDTSNNNVSCNGSFSGSGASNTVVTTSAISMRDNCVSLLFKDGVTKYVVTAEKDPSGNINVKAVKSSSGSPYPDSATFVAHQFWSYTMFQNKEYNHQYLGCDSSGNATLVGIKKLQYPTPQVLFILNEV